MLVVFVVVLYFVISVVSFFFFQAEDGIRDIGVTGVQTCALPISMELSDSPKKSFLRTGTSYN